MKPKFALRSLVFGTIVLAAKAGAATYYFDGGGTTTTGLGWGTASVWSDDLAGTIDSTASPLAADDVIFSITGAAAGIIGMNAAREANSITFSSGVANTLQAHTTSTTANSLTIGAGGVTVSSGAGAVTFGVSNRGILTTTLGASQSWTHDGANALSVIQPVSLGANTLTLAGNGAGTTSISGKISGTGGLIMNKTGGAVTLSGANDYSGGFTLSNGRVENVTGAYAGFGTGTLTINGGNMHFSGSSTIANDMIWNGSFQFSRPGTGTPIVIFNGDAELTGDFTTSQSSTQPVSGVVFNGGISATGATKVLTLGTGGTTHTANGSISGSVALTKTGAASLYMNGANNFSGALTVSDGAVYMRSPSTIGGLSVASGKTFVYAPTSAGALDLGSGSFTLASAVAANTALGGTLSQSAITTTGAAPLSGTGVVNIRTISGVTPAAGTHNLITAASGLGGGTYTLGTVFNNTNFTLSNFTRSATAISVDVASAPALSGDVYWKGALTGNTTVWSASNGSTTSNWVLSPAGAAQALVPGATSDLIFSANSPGTMASNTLGANMEVRSITINNTGSAFSLTNDAFNSTLTITPSTASTGITIASGVQALSIAAPIVLGADQKWTNGSANLFSVSGAINNAGNDLEIAGTTTITGLISGSGGLIKSGSGKLILSNASNSYSGKTIVTGGILQDGIAWNNGQGSIPGGEGNASTGSNLELNGGIVALTWFLQRSLGNGPGQVQLTGGRSGFTSLTNPRTTWTMGADANYEAVWGALGEGAATGFFNPSTFVMNDAAASPGDAFILANKVDLNGANRTIEAASTVHRGEVSGVIRNSSLTTAAGLIKTGVGELRLSAANTFNGVTTISAGTLNLTNSLAIQNSALDTTNSIAGTATDGLKTNQTTLTLGGLIGDKDFDDTAGSVFTSASGGYSALTALTLRVGTGNTHSYSGAIGNGAATTSLTKTGSGTQILSGSNSYTGATSVTAGTLNIAAGGSTHASSAVTVSNSGSALVVNGTINGTLTANVSTTVSGSGTVAGAATVSGALNPGTGSGVLSFGNNLTMANTTATTMQIDGAVRDSGYDGINVGSALAYDGSLTLALGATFGTNQTFNLFDLFSSQTGDFDTVALTGNYTATLLNDGFGVWSATTNSGNESWVFTQSTGDLVLNVIPEPSSALLGALGAILLFRRRR